MIVLIDNYDSFVHNLARYLRQLGHETMVVRNDAISVRELATLRPSAIVLSPGPCDPKQAGICLDVVRELHTSVPMLGICLGHQVIAEAFGGKVVRAKEPVHGRASSLHHRAQRLFEGIPSPIRVARYHSLVVTDLPPCLEIDAQLANETIMAFSHEELPIFGWQFHPESVLTDFGYSLLVAFLRSAGLPVPEDVEGICEAKNVARDQADWFSQAIRFPM